MNIDEIRARCEAATPGPWKQTDTLDYAEIHGFSEEPGAIALVAASNNADLIAHAREDIPYLLSEVDRLTTELEAKETINRLYMTTLSMQDSKFRDVIKERVKLQEENANLTKELSRLAIESVNREKQLAKLEAEVQHWADAESDGDLIVISAMPQDMENILEPLKLASALQSECLKLEFRKEHKPKDISILDYTIIAALKKCLEAEQAKAGREDKHD